jgi:hypothetical protein
VADIDLLVSLADLDQAAETLRAIGYRNNTGVLETYYRENHHHLPFYRPAATPVDLHFHAMVGFGTVVPAAVLLERARLHKRSVGQPAWVLAPEDEALYLLLHAARHLFLDPLWLYDVKLYLRCYPHLDWERIADSARSLRVVSALSLAFEVLEQRLGVSVPERSCFEPRHRWLAAFGRLAMAVTARQPPGSGRETTGRMLFRALLCDRPLDSAWALRTRMARFVRRRAQRCLSVIVPARWSA